jgi:hypothetical protein
MLPIELGPFAGKGGDAVLLFGESIDALQVGLFCVLMPAVFLAMLPITAALERRRLRRAKARFLCGRHALSDAEFLSRAGVGPDQETFFLAARRAMASLSDVPADMIYPEDTWRSLMDLQWDNGYLEDIVFALERELNMRLPYAYPADDRLPFAVFVVQLAKCFERAKDGGDDAPDQWNLIHSF